ncbi:MAG: bifunctional diaminohydroxyphosphoribosylaminopyrimidine deaminase/5-amino-6-(5-phosphoribosylamino)uracil reductase RibD [Myxococcales bacterium]|jgi:diaminohydroxyphosphoribosylaminopyrimidine deaminase/5-amino-6-(5-phosphoribosylamino)uracil reductase|nr:bifunctional diaminohydroxyphosphoribosylaminopyrimidine deaminase/5-amino-6-(5-phosphoribosylamino)uracil reductase RibD [Myxococcales bacterium]
MSPFSFSIDQTRQTLSEVERFMALALSEARQAEGRTRPNPCVGVVIVQGGEIVGRGFHARAGAPHAEIIALRQAGARARGADLYSTLEPCDHQGRTPPCTQAILDAGIARVFVGCADANPRVSGRGIERLRANGVEVVCDVLRQACADLNAPFFKFITQHRPLVTLKVAATADGKIATRSGDSRWVTGKAARALTHDWRARVDAILVGGNTVRRDDPELTARPGGARAEHQPLRVVLSASLDLPLEAKLFREQLPNAPVLVVTTCEDRASIEALRGRGVEVQVLGPGADARVSLADLLDLLAARDVMHLLVEGGAGLFGGFIEQGLFDRIELFIAPKLLGDGLSWAALAPRDAMSTAIPLELEGMERVGEDARLAFGRGCV